MSNRPNPSRGKARVFDLDKNRAARAEARGENPFVEAAGQRFELLPELPMAFVEVLATGAVSAALAMMLVDQEQTADFVALGFTNEDLGALTEEIYGASLGNS